MRYLILVMTAVAVTASAQFNVTLNLPRNTYIALESIPASVAITNRSGADVILGGPGRGSWLSFEMTDISGRPLAPIEVSGDELVKLAAGETIQRRVVVTDAYSPTEIGNYALTARVLHKPTGEYYVSNRARFSVTDVKPMWEQPFGVPQGYKDAGSERRYAVILFTELDSTSLYFRLIDDRSGLRLQTFRLGPVSMAHDPQITIDRGNDLHVLFTVQPRLYTHCVVGPDGVLKKRAYYREGGARPQLAQAASGDVRVVGGVFFDPAAPPPKPQNGGRGVSERPPGL